VSEGARVLLTSVRRRLKAALTSVVSVCGARWVAAHMFSGCLAHEAAELLTVAAFTGPSSLPQPGACLLLYLSMLLILTRVS
jgi:Nrap protein PAP/OAS1-like domain 5